MNEKEYKGIIVEGIPADSDFYRIGEWNTTTGRALAAKEDLKEIRITTLVGGIWYEQGVIDSEEPITVEKSEKLMKSLASQNPLGIIPAYKILTKRGVRYSWSRSQMLQLMKYELENNKTLEPAIHDRLLDQYNELHQKTEWMEYKINNEEQMNEKEYKALANKKRGK